MIPFSRHPLKGLKLHKKFCTKASFRSFSIQNKNECNLLNQSSSHRTMNCAHDVLLWVTSRCFSHSRFEWDKHNESNVPVKHHVDTSSCSHDHNHEHGPNCKHASVESLQSDQEAEQTKSKGTPIGRVEPQLAMIYTCKRCEKRSMQQFSRISYEKGTVVVRCPGCQVLHLIADNLGIFTDERTNVFDYIKEKGGEVNPKIHSIQEVEEKLREFGIETGVEVNVDVSTFELEHELRKQ